MSSNELVSTRADTELFGMLQLQAPFRMGMKRVPVVRFAAELLERFGKAGAGVYRLCANRIRCGLVDGHRIPRGEHAHVGHDGCVVVGESIAAGRDSVAMLTKKQRCGLEATTAEAYSAMRSCRSWPLLF